MPPARVFRRATVPDPPVAVSASGSTIVDAEGRRYLDAAGGAVVVNVGHGRREIAEAMAVQAARIAYAHGSAFTSEPLEAYAAELGPHLPVDGAAIYPVSGGSEAIETALKLARAYHLARGDRDRTRVIARWGSYHGNTMGALDLSGRELLRRPYEPWLGRFEHVSAAYPYRAGEPASHASGDPAALADELERAIARRPGTVAAFVAEPIVGATLGAVLPPDGYWPRMAEVCHRHGVLLIADEVMTGFGRTGRWFGVDHWGIRPDLLVAAKGASSGYWPFGFVAASGAVHAAVTAPGARFVHGFTNSHHPVGAAVARAVLTILEQEHLVEASARKGDRLRTALEERLGPHPRVGEVRGRGLLVGIELVEDRGTRSAFARSAQVVERVVAGARERGVLVYWGTGSANGTDGDTILLGPPFVATGAELEAIVDRLGATVEDVLGS